MNIQYMKGSDNVIAGTLSRTEAVVLEISVQLETRRIFLN